MNTFEIKLTVLGSLGVNANKEKAEELYQWLMEELELKQDDDEKKVTHLKTIQ